MNKKNWGSPYDRNQSKGQDIGTPEITIKGKKIKVKDWINEGADEAGLYATLEKYGTINVTKTVEDEIYGEIENMDLLTATKKLEEGEKIWKELPLEIRREFGHDKKRFIDEGQEWAKRKTKENKEAYEKEQAEKLKKEDEEEQEKFNKRRKNYEKSKEK